VLYPHGGSGHGVVIEDTSSFRQRLDGEVLPMLCTRD
jgi:hypothetical protein